MQPTSSDLLCSDYLISLCFQQVFWVFISYFCNSYHIPFSLLALCQSLSVVPRLPRAKSCLLTPPPPLQYKDYGGSLDNLPAIVDHINQHCQTQRSVTGNFTPTGAYLQRIYTNYYEPQMDGERCLEVPPEEAANMTWLEFTRRFVLASRPVVLKQTLPAWQSLRRQWSTQRMKSLYGHVPVHVKLAPFGDFEGVEPLDSWRAQEGFSIPAAVAAQLARPDVVVVRPAYRDLLFSDFLDMIALGPNATLPGLAPSAHATAYLEYTSIASTFPLLAEDLEPLPPLADALQLDQLNIWLNAGRALGKLHFDPYENLLAMVAGVKELTLYPPHNNQRLYEGHLVQAQLRLKPTLQGDVFARDTLMDSTSMVMSPVDLQRPDLERYPLFADAKSVRCRIEPGDMLYMPSFWWHQVQSLPDSQQQRNLAINWWFAPVLTKEFPCASCGLEWNQEDYGPLLRALLAAGGEREGREAGADCVEGD